MSLGEIFWQEYRGRFGEPKLPLEYLGCASLTVRLVNNGETEDLLIEGTGYRWEVDTASSFDGRRIDVVLESILKRYNISGKVVSRSW